MVRLPQSLKPVLIGASVSLLLVIFSSTAVAEAERGQALYENHCQVCHDSWVHRREDRQVTSIMELQRRIRAWSTHSGLDWEQEEIDDVTDYLNGAFYRFEETSDRK